MSVQMQYGAEARKALLSGAQKLNKAVSSTLGPAGRWVIFRHMGYVVSTKDGVTVAREVHLSDPYEAMGADMVKAAAGQAVDEAGDGTTTATLLATAIFEQGCKAIDEEEAEPVQLVAGIQAAVKAIVGEYDAKKKKFQGGILETFAVPVTPELAFNAAKISANGDEAIAKVVSDAVLKVGVEGALTIGNSFSQDHVLEVTDGLQIDAGYVHPYLMNDPQRNRTVLENVTTLVVNRRINSAQEVISILTAAVKCAQSKNIAFTFLLIADDYDPEAIENFVHNKMKQEAPLRIVAIRAPLWGDARRDLLEDIAVVTGGRRVEAPQGKAYERLSREDFGQAKRVVVTPTKTILTSDDLSDMYRENVLQPHLDGIKAMIGDEGLRPDQIDAAKGRLAALTGGVAVIKVGGTSADSINQSKFQVEDAIHACRAAVSDGVVPGGGSALLFARAAEPDAQNSLMNTDAMRGMQLLFDCLAEPIRRIAENAGHDSDRVIRNVKVMWESSDGTPNRCGFDAGTGLEVEDMIAAGIVDPLRVVRSSLNAAASQACVMLKTQAIIALEQEKK